MHIPDGFLNIATVATTYAVSTGGIGYALRQARKKLADKHVPLMGIMAAFIFAAQMLNFPIIGGTSGHLIGAALAAILLGPWAAVLIMTCVLIAQSLIFQDGGLLALGANILNMGIIASISGYYLYRLITGIMGTTRQGIRFGSFIAAWGSVVFASIACAIELWVSGIVPIHVVLPAMAGWHSIIGIGEGLITVAVLSLVMATRADLLALKRI
ncbi:MAG: energy-coupling factor ABC transporter permease [Dehalococcoidia bacterium]|jgi:cobalt/nickel transport system permease protein|nr:energy-coupling factor ABC transporter permease [Dehalococcoidia bacterium]